MLQIAEAFGVALTQSTHIRRQFNGRRRRAVLVSSFQLPVQLEKLIWNIFWQLKFLVHVLCIPHLFSIF